MDTFTQEEQDILIKAQELLEKEDLYSFRSLYTYRKIKELETEISELNELLSSRQLGHI